MRWGGGGVGERGGLEREGGWRGEIRSASTFTFLCDREKKRYSGGGRGGGGWGGGRERVVQNWNV